MIFNGELVGKHGPGATQDKLVSNDKWRLNEWTQRLESILPCGEQLIPNWRYYRQLDHVTIREPQDESPVRVTSVPKTLKTPRIIAIEPTCMQYAQQALLKPMVELLESDDLSPHGFDHNVACGMIGFSDQNPNRNLAMLGSRDSQLATLDLSEASDRVSLMHVHALFNGEKWPHLLELVLAARSRTASVPGWGIVPLAKYASMGSALCFPVEAMVFLTLVFLGIERSMDTTLTRSKIRSFRERVRVYGDDIIVPVDAVNHVVDTLEANALKVNRSKSFWNGKFRESCGGDYYDGNWVTPVRLRRDLPTDVTHAKELTSLVAFRNELYQAGYWKTCQTLDRVLTRLTKGHFPPIKPESNLLGRHTFLDVAMHPKEIGEFYPIRWSRFTHVPLVRGYVRTDPIPETENLEDYAALRKCLDPLKSEPFEDPQHLKRGGRPKIARTQLRWRPLT